MSRKSTASPKKADRGQSKLDTPWTRWIKAARALSGYDQVEFAKYVGKSRSSIAMYETGTPIPIEVVAAIRTNFPSVPRPPDSGDVLAIATLSAGEPELMTLPYAGIVPAGSDWGDPLSNEDRLAVDRKFSKPGRFICKVQGHSCYPALQQGDMTIWENDRAPMHGLVVLAERSTDRACTVKELCRTNGRDALHAINTEYEAPPEIDGWEVTAKLIAVISHADGPEEQWFDERGLRAEFLTRKRK